MHQESDRDRAVDRALTHVLGGLSSPTGETCVDGETLAAWTSGSLAPAQAATVERHLSDCARCQTMLASFVRTAPPVVETPSLWRRWRLQWVVPFATAAAALAIWVAVPAQKPALPAAAAPADRVARFEAPPPPPMAPVAPVKPAQEPATPVAEKSVEQKKALRRQPAKVNELAARGTGQRAEADKEQQLPVAAATPAERDRDAREAPDALRKQATDAPAREDARGGLQERVAVAPSTIAEHPPVTVASPEPANRWRVVGGRTLEYSTTGGARWEAAAISPPATLTAGASPSARVCWMVGRAGAVYLTTDGRRFDRIPFDNATDLVSVNAVDDRTATVVTADGRSFRTTNRGASWVR